jgi:hypothetical protein
MATVRYLSGCRAWGRGQFELLTTLRGQRHPLPAFGDKLRRGVTIRKEAPKVKLTHYPAWASPWSGRCCRPNRSSLIRSATGRILTEFEAKVRAVAGLYHELHRNLQPAGRAFSMDSPRGNPRWKIVEC